MASFDDVAFANDGRGVAAPVLGLARDHRIKLAAVHGLLGDVIVEYVHLILSILITEQDFPSLGFALDGVVL